MTDSLKIIIESELKNNLTFQPIFSKFKIPNLNSLNETLDLVYKSNEYMGYYKNELYFTLEPHIKTIKCTGTLKLTFVSSVKNFDINKAMHLTKTDETHNISLTFMIYNEGNRWDSERYNYTLWKSKTNETC